MQDHKSGYSRKSIDSVEIIYYDRNIYVPLSLCIFVIYRYHFYLNHPGGNILSNEILQVLYWKVFVIQAYLCFKM